MCVCVRVCVFCRFSCCLFILFALDTEPPRSRILQGCLAELLDVSCTIFCSRANAYVLQDEGPEVGREMLPVPVVSVRGAEPRLAVTVAIPGWLRTPDDAIGVWNSLRPKDSSAYALIWETPELLSLNISIVKMIKDKVGSSCPFMYK